MTYPDKTIILNTLLAAAELAGKSADVNHPEDFAITMSMAIESAGSLLQWQHENGYLDQRFAERSAV